MNEHEKAVLPTSFICGHDWARVRHYVGCPQLLAWCSRRLMGMASRFFDPRVGYRHARRAEAFSQGGSRTTRWYLWSEVPAEIQHRVVTAAHGYEVAMYSSVRYDSISGQAEDKWPGRFRIT